jgi:hypothetical protein
MRADVLTPWYAKTVVSNRVNAALFPAGGGVAVRPPPVMLPRCNRLQLGVGAPKPLGTLRSESGLAALAGHPTKPYCVLGYQSGELGVLALAE